MMEATTRIGILYVDIFIAGSRSLKEKRMVLRSIKDRVRAKFNVSVGELDNQDKWQLATLAFSIIGNDNRYIDSVLQKVLSFIDNHRTVTISGHKFEFC